MPLPPSGTITMSQVDVELGKSPTATVGLGDADVRKLAKVPAGQISMSDLWGKSGEFSTEFNGGTNVNLRSVAVANGWDGTSLLKITNQGNIGSSATGSPALTIDGSFPGGVVFTNNGKVIGKGGNGGVGGGANGGQSPGGGGGGGPAINISSPVSIINNGIIGGGGGGGGGGTCISAPGIGIVSNGGGGGGGGAGVSSGGPAAPGQTTMGNPGGPGTYDSPGAFGTGTYNGANGGNGGNGGAWGTNGEGGKYGTKYTQSYVVNGGPGGGGAAGAAVNGNGNVDWVSYGTIYGPRN